MRCYKSSLIFITETQAALQAGIHLEQIEALPVRAEIARMKELQPEEAITALTALKDQVQRSFARVGSGTVIIPREC